MNQPHRATATCWIVSPQAAPRLAARLRGRVRAWCYWGADVAQRSRLERALAGAVARTEIGPELTGTAKADQGAFLDWIARIGRAQPDQAAWWSTSLASPNPLDTDLFALACYARVVQRWLSDDAQEGRLIVVEDPWLLATLRRALAGEPRVQVGRAPGQRAAREILWRCRAIRARCAIIVWALRVWLQARRHAADERLAGLRADGQAVFLYTWIQPQCFRAGQAARDPWTGRLDALLSQAGHAVGRVTPLLAAPSLLARLREFAAPCVAASRYLRLRDLAWAAAHRFRLAREPDLPDYCGWDLRLLLRRECRREAAGGNALALRLEYRAMRRLARAWGADTRCVIYPFENLAWEKLFCLAWRAEAPRARLIGYQHSAMLPLLMTYALSPEARAQTPLPDRILANSETHLDALRRGGFPQERLSNGGALRYEYLLERAASSARVPAAGRPRTVAVALPLLRSHAEQLLADLLASFAQPLVLESAPVRFIVKAHPSLEGARWLGTGAVFPSWITMTREPLAQVLDAADLLLYVGPTSSGLEAWLAGIPVLRYGGDLIEMDWEAGVPEWSVPSCAASTLREAVRAALSGREPRVPLPRRVLEQVFAPVDAAAWQAAVAGAAPALNLAEACR